MKNKLSYIIALSIISLTCLVACGKKEAKPADINVLFDDAILDSMVADEDEIFPLVSLNSSDDMVSFNEDGEVLLLTWHSYPDSYKEGDTISLEYGDVWTFTDKEIISWYGDHEDEMEDYNLRLNQLIGLRPEDKNTHITAMWVSTSDVLRPAYQEDVKENSMSNTYSDDMENREWFDQNILGSYYSDYQYPWTRLGYTYDWAENSGEYGLTEFLVLKNSEVEIEFTYTTEEFVEYLKEMAA